MLDAVIQRAKPGRHRVMCDGEVIYARRQVHQGRSRRRAQARCTRICSKALADDEVERRKLSKALLPHVRAFYADYIDPARHEPFYRSELAGLNSAKSMVFAPHPRIPITTGRLVMSDLDLDPLDEFRGGVADQEVDHRHLAKISKCL